MLYKFTIYKNILRESNGKVKLVTVFNINTHVYRKLKNPCFQDFYKIHGYGQ